MSVQLSSKKNLANQWQGQSTSIWTICFAVSLLVTLDAQALTKADIAKSKTIQTKKWTREVGSAEKSSTWKPRGEGVYPKDTAKNSPAAAGNMTNEEHAQSNNAGKSYESKADTQIMGSSLAKSPSSQNKAVDPKSIEPKTTALANKEGSEPAKGTAPFGQGSLRKVGLQSLLDKDNANKNVGSTGSANATAAAAATKNTNRGLANSGQSKSGDAAGNLADGPAAARNNNRGVSNGPASKSDVAAGPGTLPVTAGNNSQDAAANSPATQSLAASAGSSNNSIGNNSNSVDQRYSPTMSRLVDPNNPGYANTPIGNSAARNAAAARENAKRQKADAANDTGLTDDDFK